MRILLIEDDSLIGDGIKIGLTKLGFVVDWFTDGRLGYSALGAAPYDAVILDLTLPHMDGLTILNQWRQENKDVPVLVLTARDTLDDKLKGLEQGADDYLCKPFALAELAARMQVLIRRCYGHTEDIIEHGHLTYSSSQRKVKLHGTELELTGKELNLLALFLKNKERVLPRALIEEKIYAWGEEVTSNALEVHIHHLRKKLGSKAIRTVHGVGYTLGKAEDV